VRKTIGVALMAGGEVDVRISRGFLKVTGEIKVASSREELETFISRIHFMLLGDKEYSKKLPSFAVTPRELTEKEAAVYIGRSVTFLRRCRMAKYAGKKNYRGPKYNRVTERTIRYPVPELDIWMAENPKYVSN
jgi:hypothetical protein